MVALLRVRVLVLLPEMVVSSVRSVQMVPLSDEICHWKLVLPSSVVTVNVAAQPAAVD
jgi:hypothetical protein